MSVPAETLVMYDSVPVDEQTRDRPVDLNGAEDASLVLRAQAGDTQAFEELVRRYRNEVFALAYHFVRERETAWDLAQEVFIKAYRSLKRFRGEASFKTWLMRITANQSKDHLKKRRIKTTSFDEAIGSAEAPSAVATPDKQLAAKELGESIQEAVDSLPPKHRTAFVLREYEGLSYEEMAQVMQCSLGTVMSRLHHARKKMQHALRRMGVMEES